MRPVRAALLVLATASCGGSDAPEVKQCTAQCEAADECPGGTGDCEGNCESDLEEAQHIDCLIEYQLLLDCIDTASDPCDTTECATRVSEYTSCLGEFCGEHPGDSRCPESQE